MFEKLRSLLTRTEARRAAQVRASYDAAASTRRTKGWNAPSVTARASTARLSVLRDRSRAAVRNDSWAAGSIETLVDDIVGHGFQALSRASETMRAKIQARWSEWADVADAGDLLDFAGLTGQAVRAWLVDGECFIRLRSRKASDGLPVPLQLEVLEADVCPHENTTVTSDKVIRQGIEFDKIGRRLAYWFRQSGEDVASSAVASKRVPADQVIHLYHPLRPGQLRGIPVLTPALVRFHELDKWDDASLLRLQLGAMFAAFLKPSPDETANVLPLSGDTVDATRNDKPMLGLEPGLFQELGHGEEVTFSDPPDPPTSHAEFATHQLRAVGAATGVPVQLLTHDWAGANDRLARVVLNQYRRHIQRLQWTVIVPALRRVWSAWFEAAGFPPSAQAVTWSPQAWSYIHPVQDVAATQAAIRAGLTSRAAAVSETGEDVETIDAAQAADNARADSLGLQLDSDGRHAKSQGATK